MSDFWKDKRVLCTGSTGFVGKHLVAALKEAGAKVHGWGSHEFNLRDHYDAEMMFSSFPGPIDVAFHLAADVGGIGYNREHGYRLLRDNLLIGLNVVHGAYHHKVGMFVGVGTVCAYPAEPPVPFKEDSLWDGYPEPSNAGYGLAKRMIHAMLVQLYENYGFKSAYLLPTNLYGPGDCFDPDRSHVIPALIRRFEEARLEGKKSVTVWGTGKATRDFLYVTDAVRGMMAAARLLEKPEPVNLGSGFEVSIGELVTVVKQATGYKGRTRWDKTRPDGQPRRALNTTRARELLDWEARTNLLDGMAKTVKWYRVNG